MTSLNGRTVPTLHGIVTTLSADSIPDQTGAAFYLARLELTPESFEDLRGQELLPGMPVDVAISTGSYTFFEYLMRPLTDSMSRALRED